MERSPRRPAIDTAGDDASGAAPARSREVPMQSQRRPDPRVLVSSTGSGFAARGPHFVVWEEHRAEAVRAARELASAAPPRPVVQGGAGAPPRSQS
jgi:hypothetical protein